MPRMMMAWMDFHEYFFIERAVRDRLDDLRRSADVEAAR
jgi:hypothetical protein